MKIFLVTGSAPAWSISWACAAFGAWFRRRGIRALPFAGMARSTNPLLTFDGGEISRASAAQCEACGEQPRAAVNPFLERVGEAPDCALRLRGAPVTTREEKDRRLAVRAALGELSRDCDVAIVDGGASAPGGVLEFAAGLESELRRESWLILSLTEERRLNADFDPRHPGLDKVFMSLALSAPGEPGAGIPLGCLQAERGPEGSSEDAEPAFPPGTRSEGELLAWVRLPTCAVLNEWQPWLDDSGVSVTWIQKPGDLAAARAVVLPGCLDTMADIRWLRSSGMAEALMAAFRRGVPIAGVCGGYQLLGDLLIDRDGVAGSRGEERGLGLLPVVTEFLDPKITRRRLSHRDRRIWPTYEIHKGRTEPTETCDFPNELVEPGGLLVPEGAKRAHAWGTYQHGWFEAPETRSMLASAAGMSRHRPAASTWQELRGERYAEMADVLEAHLDLSSLRRRLDFIEN